MTEHLHHFSRDLDHVIDQHSQSPAFIIKHNDIDEIVFSYQEVNILINRCLSYYKKELDLQAGEVIVALLPNSIEMLICFLAAMKGGYNFAPLPCTATHHEIEKWLRLTKPAFCLSTTLVNKQRIPNSAKLAEINCDLSFSWLPKETAGAPLVESAQLYLSTSGTTGEPKAMVIDINRLWSSARAFSKVHELQKQTPLRFWNYLPMSYLGGLFNLALIPLCNGASIFIDTPFNGQTFLQFWQTVNRFEINALWLVPTVINGLLKFANRNQHQHSDTLQKIKFAFLGTAPISQMKKAEFEKTFGVQLLENYGLSETTFISTETLKDKTDNQERGTGKILPYVEVKFTNSSSENKQASKLLAKTPYAFLGYLKEDGKLQQAVEDGGFFTTGDLGFIAENGILHLTGRDRDIIKKGGNFIALREIEILAEKNPGVQEAIAVPIQHPFYGESYNLYILPCDNYNSTRPIEDITNSHIHENLVQYKWPETIKIVTEIPKTASGKVKKHLLNGEELK